VGGAGAAHRDRHRQDRLPEPHLKMPQRPVFASTGRVAAERHEPAHVDVGPNLLRTVLHKDLTTFSKYSEFQNTNNTYGSQKNKADEFAKIGKREQLHLAAHVQQIQRLDQQINSERLKSNQQRFFETTTGNFHDNKVN